MELVRCKNCLAVYGDLQDECPTCGADPAGNGAEVELDGTTRAAVSELGGIFGGILEAGGSAYVLWCERGVVRFDLDCGHRWSARARGRVEDVSVRQSDVVVETSNGRAVLDLQNGEVA